MRSGTAIPRRRRPREIMDVTMLLAADGHERTAPQFEALFAKAGLRMTRIIPTQPPVSIIEAVAS